MKILRNILLLLITSLLVLYISTYLDGVNFVDYPSAIIAMVVLSIINAFIKPIVKFLAFPITCLTLGLFALVINALFIMLTAWIVPGFEIDGFLWALGFSIIVSIISAFVNMLGD